MNLSPINQTNLFSLDNYLLEFAKLYKIKKKFIIIMKRKSQKKEY